MAAAQGFREGYGNIDVPDDKRGKGRSPIKSIA